MFGALRVEDGNSLTFTSRSRNSEGYIKLLRKIERAIPKGIIHVIADNLKTHKSVPLGNRASRRSDQAAAAQGDAEAAR